MKQKPFIKLSQDLMFQIFFKRSSRCLISLLNAFIPMPKGKTIIDAQILDPSILPDAPKGKVSIMDIKVRLNDGKLINIELQTFNQKRFKSRALYYWAKLYSDQLKEKDEYFKLKKTISLIFADFILLNRGDRLLIKGEGARKGGSKKNRGSDKRSDKRSDRESNSQKDKRTNRRKNRGSDRRSNRESNRESNRDR